MMQLDSTSGRVSFLSMPGTALRVLISFGALFAVNPPAATGDSPGEFSPERSRLIAVDEGEPSVVDPYDDLGDFVATYEVRLIDDLNSPSQHLQVGRVEIARRGDWVCISDAVQQPIAAADGRIDAPWLQSAWIFHDGVCEGYFLNSQMTVDPNGLFPPEGHLIRPMRLGLGWAVSFDSDSGRWKLLGNEEAAAHFSQGRTPPVTLASRGGVPMEYSERAAREQVTEWASCTKYTAWQKVGAEARALAAIESGLKFSLAGGGESEVLLNSTTVKRWTGKLPSEIVSVSYRPPEIAGLGRAEGEALLSDGNSPSSLEGRKRSECVMTLLNVRTATAADRIAIADWEAATDSLAFVDPSSATQEVRTRSEDDQVMVHWRVNPVSQRWELVQ